MTWNEKMALEYIEARDLETRFASYMTKESKLAENLTEK